MKFFKQSWRRWATAAMLFAGVAQVSNAQTIIWGAGSSNPTIDSIGRFAGPGADTILSTSGWIPTPVSSPIYGMWARTFSGDGRGPNLAGPSVVNRLRLTSPSLADGAAIFDSDFYLGASAGSAPQSGYITSPIIDLTGQTGASLQISIHTAYLDYDTDTSSIGFSIDGGTVWNNVDVRTLAGPTGRSATFNGQVLMNISPYIATATDLDSCLIRFNFVGDSYHWLIDDVNIQTAPPFDLSISGTTSGPALSDAFTTVHISNNYFTPLSQVDSSDYAFGARILNSGTDSITAANNAKLMLMIERETAANVWALEHTDSLAIDTVAPDARVIVVDDLNWLPTQVGRYRATYFVTQDLADATTLNDTSRHIFNITEDDGYYSKVPLEADGGVATDGIGLPSASTGTNLVSGFEWGNMYYFPTGASYQIDSVNFRAFINNAGAGYTGGTISVRIAKYTDLNNDGVLDDSPTSGELVLVGLGTVDMTSVTPGFKRASVVPFDLNAEPLVLSDTSIYLFSLSQDRAAGLVDANDRLFGYAYASTTTVNYGLNAAFLSAIPTPLRVAEIPATGGAVVSNEWNWIGFGPDEAPSIGINMSPAVVSTNRITPTATHNVLLFPNPAEDIITVKVDLTATGNIQYLMTDVTGRVVRMNTTRNVQNDMVSFNVADLAAGVYMVTVKTAQGTSTERFVKK